MSNIQCPDELSQVKALSLWEPWASFIALGIKQYETRSWGTSYRGDLLICAAKRKGVEQKSSWLYLRDKHLKGNQTPFEDLSFGRAIALVTLADCIKMTPQFINQQSERERDCGDWRVGRFAWKFENVRPIVENIPVTGKQGIFVVDFEAKVRNA